LLTQKLSEKGQQEMAEITRTVEDADVDWRMASWSCVDKKFPATDHFEAEPALALLLINDVVFLNSHWGKGDWPEAARKTTSLNVNCNDIFAWACADAEPLQYDDIETVYRMWRSDPAWGAAKWCAIRRNQKPQPPVIAAMKKAGSWDDMMDRLGENTQDAEVQAYFAAYADKMRGERVDEKQPT
jgi:hypothetical protein